METALRAAGTAVSAVLGPPKAGNALESSGQLLWRRNTLDGLFVFVALCWLFHENFTLQLLDLCICSNGDSIDILQNVSISFLQFVRSYYRFFLFHFVHFVVCLQPNPPGLNMLNYRQEVAHQAERFSAHSVHVEVSLWVSKRQDSSGILCQTRGTLPVSKPWCVVRYCLAYYFPLRNKDLRSKLKCSCSLKAR